MELIQFLTTKNIPFVENVSLSKMTWIKTGGVCACWITPISVEQLKEVCRYLYSNHIPFDLVGQTSNIFFHSTYNPQVVVSTVKVNNYEINNGIITSDCGVSVIKLAKDCLSKGYAGFYGLVGLPGTVASAVFNNAGCFQCSISSMLISADVLLPDGTIQTLFKKDFNYSDRSSVFKRGEMKGIILSVRLKAEKAENMEEELKKAEASANYRKNKQEGYQRNLGSVYAKRIPRKNLRYFIIKSAMKVLPKLTNLTPRYIQKRMTLFLYGYSDLNVYVSDKQLNTFIWRDDNSEKQFDRYKEMMSMVYRKLEIEIEEHV